MHSGSDGVHGGSIAVHSGSAGELLGSILVHGVCDGEVNWGTWWILMLMGGVLGCMAGVIWKYWGYMEVYWDICGDLG